MCLMKTSVHLALYEFCPLSRLSTVQLANIFSGTGWDLWCPGALVSILALYMRGTGFSDIYSLSFCRFFLLHFFLSFTLRFCINLSFLILFPLSLFLLPSFLYFSLSLTLSRSFLHYYFILFFLPPLIFSSPVFTRNSLFFFLLSALHYSFHFSFILFLYFHLYLLSVPFFLPLLFSACIHFSFLAEFIPSLSLSIFFSYFSVVHLYPCFLLSTFSSFHRHDRHFLPYL